MRRVPLAQRWKVTAVGAAWPLATPAATSGPGELVHVDIKKLGRIERGAAKRIIGGSNCYGGSLTDAADRSRRKVGWEYVHVHVDDATPLAYAELLADEKAKTAIGFLSRAVRCVRRYGVRVERVLTDNGSADRSTIHALACRILALKHLRSRPRRPQTNGTAERSSARRSAAGPTLELSADGCA